MKSIHSGKVYLVGYNSVADNTGLSSFVYLLLPPKHEKCREIPKECDLTAVQGHLSFHFISFICRQHSNI